MPLKPSAVEAVDDVEPSSVVVVVVVSPVDWGKKKQANFVNIWFDPSSQLMMKL